jgi:glucose-fructose oxidoreductase
MLPAFENAKENAELVALVSDDPDKLRLLGREYGVRHLVSYDRYDDLLRSGEIDAVYIALPNSLHREYTVRAAAAGVHVLCEKPMAVTEDECREMIAACDRGKVKLMIAYRLHFEEANLRALEMARRGKLGDVRLFTSVFTQQVMDEDNIRLQRHLGGGTLYDIGIYCINAARNVFGDEPSEVFAFTASREDRRFTEVEEMASAVLHFPRERLASFNTSFGADATSTYLLTGTRASLYLDPAYDIDDDLRHVFVRHGRRAETIFPRRDQFSPQLIHFSNCILRDEAPRADGWEGLADVRVITALYESATSGQRVQLPPLERHHPAKPGMEQEIHKPVVEPKVLVGAEEPSG